MGKVQGFTTRTATAYIDGTREDQDAEVGDGNSDIRHIECPGDVGLLSKISSIRGISKIS